MRPPVKSPEQELAEALALQLLSPSRRFENPRAVASRVARDGLRALGTLDKLAKLSLPVQAPPAPATAAPAARPLAAPAPAAAPAQVRYQSARQEYKPALNDQSVIQALLELHRQRRNPRATLSGLPLPARKPKV